MSCTVIYAGTNLGDYCKTAGFKLSALPGVETNIQPVPGRNGAAYLGSSLEPLELKVKLRLDAGSICPVAIHDKWAEVASLLRPDGDLHELSFGGDRYYMAVLTGATEIDVRGYYGDVEVTFLCPDPIAYGAEREVVVPSGGSVEFMVGGSQPAAPVITAEAVRGSTGLWGLRLDEGDYLRVATGTASAARVTLDCGQRSCHVAGAVALPTLTSDWFELAPGVHVLRNDQGAGAATVTWRERWL